MKHTWVVVADSATAQLYRFSDNRHSLTEQETLVHPESRLHVQELTSDLPGRAFDHQGSARHALGHAGNPKRQQALSFAKDIAKNLEAKRNDGQIGHLIVVAPPTFLGLLRNELSSECLKCVSHTLAKNLVGDKPEVIADHIKALG